MAEPVYRPVILMVLAIFRGLGLRLTVRGLDHLPRSGGAVIAINHISYLDFALTGRAILPTGRLIRFMAKKAIFDVPILGALMRGMKHISVDRSAGAGAYLEAVAALERGELVGVFPEGTISLSFELKEFKSGAARMAQQADVPIIPVIVWGGQRVWTKRHRPRLSKRGIPIHIAIGSPLTPTGEPAEVTAHLHAVMTELLHAVQREYPDSPLGQWWAPSRLGGTAPRAIG